MMWFWITLAVWLVGVLACTYALSRWTKYDEETVAMLAFGWPLWAVMLSVTYPFVAIAELGEKHARKGSE